MSLIIYTTKDDIWIDKIKEYADYNSWSLSKAVRQILKAFVQVNMPGKPETAMSVSIKEEEKLYYSHLATPEEPVIPSVDKIDLATFEAINMAKLNVNQNMEACIKEHTVDGKISCYMFDNAREYHPFCKSECWTRSDIWHKRVRL